MWIAWCCPGCRRHVQERAPAHLSREAGGRSGRSPAEHPGRGGGTSIQRRGPGSGQDGRTWSCEGPYFGPRARFRVSGVGIPISPAGHSQPASLPKAWVTADRGHSRTGTAACSWPPPTRPDAIPLECLSIRVQGKQPTTLDHTRSTHTDTGRQLGLVVGSTRAYSLTQQLCHAGHMVHPE